jgi:hypothetical protein
MIGKPEVILVPDSTSQLAPSPVKSGFRKVELAESQLPKIPFLGTNSLSYDFPRMRRRDLTVGEFVVLRMIQQGYGLQNSLGKVFFTDTDEAAIFVKASTGRSVLMANLTNLAAWRADGRITSDEELKSDWLLLK